VASKVTRLWEDFKLYCSIEEIALHPNTMMATKYLAGVKDEMVFNEEERCCYDIYTDGSGRMDEEHDKCPAWAFCVITSDA